MNEDFREYAIDTIYRKYQQSTQQIQTTYISPIVMQGVYLKRLQDTQSIERTDDSQLVYLKNPACKTLINRTCKYSWV